jgi:hypothetical protein
MDEYVDKWKKLIIFTFNIHLSTWVKIIKILKN